MKLTAFQGIKPRTSPRLLGDTAAQIATNTNLSSGEARPLCLPDSVFNPTKTGPFLSLYKADSLWFVWPRDVDVCRSPLPGTVKWVYSGDGEPRITTAAMAVDGGDAYPMTARSLGVPKPHAAPTVTPSGGTATAVTRYYAYTFYDDWNQESAPTLTAGYTTHAPDGDWAISGMDDAPTSSGTGTVTVAAGVTTFTNGASAKHWLRVGDEVVIGTTTVAVSAIDSASAFKVPGDFTGALSWRRAAAWGTCKKRLYRTSGTLAQFQMVSADVEADTVRWNAGTKTFTDDILDIDIPGDELVSSSWELPPADLEGVFLMPSGALCGFSGNEACFSEPFQPHAWPPEYRMRSEYPIVGAGLFTSGVVLGTTGTPVVILGHEPGQMSAQPVTGAYPCLNKRSMVSLGDRVGYATAHGYATIGDAGVDILTKDWYTRDDWSLLVPSGMVAETVRGRLYIVTGETTSSMLVFDWLDGTGLTMAHVSATELYADSISGKLYLSDAINQDVREFDPVAGVYMNQDWMSKEFVLPEPVNLGAARVNFESRWTQAQYDALLAVYTAEVASNNALLVSGDVGGELGGDEFGLYEIAGSALYSPVSPDLELPGVDFALYVNGAVKYERRVTNTLGFPLPSGYKSDTYSVRVQGQSLVKSIDLAQTMLGLKGA